MNEWTLGYLTDHSTGLQNCQESYNPLQPSHLSSLICILLLISHGHQGLCKGKGMVGFRKKKRKSIEAAKENDRFKAKNFSNGNYDALKL